MGVYVMSKWHINFEGKPGKCEATNQCLFARENLGTYDSFEEASSAYQISQKVFNTSKNKKHINKNNLLQEIPLIVQKDFIDVDKNYNNIKEYANHYGNQKALEYYITIKELSYGKVPRNYPRHQNRKTSFDFQREELNSYYYVDKEFSQSFKKILPDNTVLFNATSDVVLSKAMREEKIPTIHGSSNIIPELKRKGKDSTHIILGSHNSEINHKIIKELRDNENLQNIQCFYLGSAHKEYEFLQEVSMKESFVEYASDIEKLWIIKPIKTKNKGILIKEQEAQKEYLRKVLVS